MGYTPWGTVVDYAVWETQLQQRLNAIETALAALTTRVATAEDVIGIQQQYGRFLNLPTYAPTTSNASDAPGIFWAQAHGANTMKSSFYGPLEMFAARWDMDPNMSLARRLQLLQERVYNMCNMLYGAEAHIQSGSNPINGAPLPPEQHFQWSFGGRGLMYYVNDQFGPVGSSICVPRTGNPAAISPFQIEYAVGNNNYQNSYQGIVDNTTNFGMTPSWVLATLFRHYSDIAGEIQTRAAADAAETTSRINGDNYLSGLVDAERARAQTIETQLSNAIQSEQHARELLGDNSATVTQLNTVQGQVNSLASNLSTEIATRASAVTIVQNSVTTVQSNLASEVTARINGDTGLSARIDATNTRIDGTASGALSSAVTSLSASVQTLQTTQTNQATQIATLGSQLTSQASAQATVNNTVTARFTSLDHVIGTSYWQQQMSLPHAQGAWNMALALDLAGQVVIGLSNQWPNTNGVSGLPNGPFNWSEDYFPAVMLYPKALWPTVIDVNDKVTTLQDTVAHIGAGDADPRVAQHAELMRVGLVKTNQAIDSLYTLVDGGHHKYLRDPNSDPEVSTYQQLKRVRDDLGVLSSMDQVLPLPNGWRADIHA